MQQEFDAVLDAIRSSPAQRALENADLRTRWKALFVGLVFGLLTGSAMVAYLLASTSWVPLLLALAAIAAFVAWDKIATSASRIAKEQDRRYFLQSLRSARSIRELNSAGLFAYLPHAEGSEFIADVRGEVTRLIAALSNNSDCYDEA